MIGIVEPILVGLSISLINKHIINNYCLSNFVLSFIRRKSKNIEQRKFLESKSRGGTSLSLQ